ncbi:unnamed protein product [Toxocara canis]|uniref:Signal transducing adapter molecule 1 n=1 Tax=Toxocara canis TaxID=6265 RepID=A0A183V1W0_TOXCA|nr:unnamed protein product [Toxocara canis]
MCLSLATGKHHHFISGDMPLFGESFHPYDGAIEKVTAETCTSENWTLILDICDRVAAEQSKGAKMCLLSLKKRLNHRDPHVLLLTLSLLDALWSNCGVHFRREVSSKEFSKELAFKAVHVCCFLSENLYFRCTLDSKECFFFLYILKVMHRQNNRAVGEKTRAMLKRWVENECKKDASLGLIESLYKNLLREGCFDAYPTSKTTTLGADPNVVQNAEEEEAIMHAIALSLDESDHARVVHPSAISVTHKCVVRDVRALYDFEAAEDNELTLSAGDIITVTDDSDPNWWRGSSRHGEGLFPASFVTPQLTEPKPLLRENERKSQQQPIRVAPVDGSVLLECLHLLEGCDPTGERPDPPELAEAEVNSYEQVPLIDAQLAEIDKQHKVLAQTDIAIRDVLATYDRAVQQLLYQVDRSLFIYA